VGRDTHRTRNRDERRSRWWPGAALAIAVAALAPPAIEGPLLAAISLTSVAPLGASSGVTIQIIGTGFDPLADRNLVRFTPQGGATTQVVAESIAILDAAKGLRRIGVRVPDGLPVGSTQVQVRNQTTGELSLPRPFDVVRVSLPEVTSATPGAQQVAVRISGSPNLQLVAGRSTATFGAGITVSAVQVLAPSSAIATISIAPTAAPGPRTVLVVNPTQTAQLVGGFTVTAVSLVSIDLTPATARFSATNATRQLTTTGRRSDGLTSDLTAASTGTTYQSSNRFVASVNADGLVTAVANGEATITATNGQLSDTSSIVVEAGVTLDAVQLTPATATLRSAGAVLPLTFTGQFSDGTTRDLTTAPGTTYVSSNTSAASVAGDGRVTAVATGTTTITATHDGRSAYSNVVVNISQGTGFLRGEAFDDTKGLPLAGVTATLVSDGGGALTSPVALISDERGQFSISGRAGDAIVSISRPGFTAVERTAVIPAGEAATLVDARLTPLDSRANPIVSAVGGTAASQNDRVRLQIPPGGIAADATLTLTSVSPQGLAALLPAGWSPLAAASIAPTEIAFGFPLALTLTNPTTFAGNSTLLLVRYDAAAHEWIAVGPAALAPGSLAFTASVDRTGHYAIVVPDTAPSAPPAASIGAALIGIERPSGPTPGITAAGEVIPRSAPPGDSAKALGRIGLAGNAPLPSGTLVQVRVDEQFDLLDRSQVVTQPFTQDLVAYATPAPSTGGSIGAIFPITPSRAFTIQELMIGVVRLDVREHVSGPGASTVGPNGGSVTSSEGDRLEIPVGALVAEAAIGLRRLTAGESGIAAVAGFDLLGVLQVDAIGVAFGAGTQLSLVSASASGTDQILIARAFVDPLGQRRLRLVAVGEVVSGRIVTRTAIGSLTLDGVRGGGDYVFLRAQQPVAFVTGVVTSNGSPVTAALVTSSSTTLSDLTPASGAYVIPVAAGVEATVRALDLASGDGATANLTVAAGQVHTAHLGLNAVGPTVIAVSPPAGASNVALDTSVTIDFSEPLDPASVTESSVALQLGGAPVAGQRTLSADRRRVVFRPSSPLTPISTYSLVLATSLRDPAGHSLSGFTPTTFSTLDPSRPPQPQAGTIVADMPDADGIVMVTGAPGTAAGGTAVVLTNVRTQETATVLALPDGSFRLRIPARLGDELILLLRGADGRDTTISISQFEGPDGSTSIGGAGGTFTGSNGRTGRVLPRALSAPGIFRFVDSDTAGLPALPGQFVYADAFTIEAGDAAFRSPASLTLSDSQGRFVPVTTSALPLTASAQLVVPADALANSTLRFSTAVDDDGGVRRTVDGATAIVAANAQAGTSDTSHAADFPTVYLSTPRETLPNQQVTVSATAPTARVDLELPRPSNVQPTDSSFVVQQVTVGTEARLLLLDRLATSTSNAAVVKNIGHELLGIRASGRYAMVSTGDALVFVTGRVSGPEAFVSIDGLPFTFRTSGPNGRFTVPARAGQSFALRVHGLDGQVLGTSTGQAPASGTIDIGNPTGASATRLTVRATPDERSVVDINAPLVLQFSEPVDDRTLAGALVITDAAGTRVFGRTVLAADGLTAAFSPTRRWRFGTTYRYGLALSVLARSGASLAAPFSGQFTTFRPVVAGTMALPSVHDVAVSGGLAIVGTDVGLQSVDVSQPRTPQAIGDVPIDGGVRAVAFVSATPLVDRNGTEHGGRLAVASTGSSSTSSTLQTFDLTTAATPTRLGSTQITAAPGQTPPPGVPALSGTPRATLTTIDGRALVAIESVGVSSVQIGQAIPLDPGNPARGGGPRYPTGPESAHDLAQVGNKLLVAGAAGLTLLDTATLQRIGGIGTTGTARGVASLGGFPMDLDGDGRIDSASEVIDLAAVANGADGTLQFFRLPATGDPALFSVLRFTGATTTTVRVDATERLAYVGLAGRGLAIVDLDGPASVQPLDLDRNSIDDRILGTIDTGGAAARLTLDTPRGIGYLADGARGLTLVQLLPPRTRFLTLTRNPVQVVTGDERSILDSGVAYLTDDGLQVSIDALGLSDEPLTLLLEHESPSPLLRFSTGAIASHLANGLNTFELAVAGTPTSSPTVVRLSVRTSLGEEVAHTTVRFLRPDTLTARLRSLKLGPSGAVLTDAAPTTQVGVAGFFDDGSVLNLTRTEAGTTYRSATPAVATVDASGQVTGLAGGVAAIQAFNARVEGGIPITVTKPVTLAALQSRSTHLTLRTIGQELAFPVVGVLSDGTLVNEPAAIPAVSFVTSNVDVVTVSTSGLLRAVGSGVTRVTANSGALQATVDVAVDPRTPTSIASISIRPATEPLLMDQAPLFGEAAIAGSGSLDGVPVTIAISNGAASQSTTLDSGIEGSVQFPLDGVGAGQAMVTASVVDPASGLTRTATAAFALVAPTSDAEPNDTPSAASTLSQGQTSSGSVGGGDARDTYRFDPGLAGRLELTLTIDSESSGNVVLIVRDASGQEIARRSGDGVLTLDLPAGAASITVESSSGGAVSYQLASRFLQADVAVQSVAPLSGGAGTLVTISGTGFSTQLTENQVFFADVAADVVAATPTQLQVQVPASAGDGPIEVISGDRRVVGPVFSTPLGAARPVAFALPHDPGAVRLDPMSGDLLDVTRLLVTAAPALRRSDVEAMAQRHGGQVVGHVPLINWFVLQFSQNTSLDGLAALRAAVSMEPHVRSVDLSQHARPTGLDTIDVLDRSGNWETTTISRKAALDLIRLEDAVRLARRTRPFDKRSGLRDVRVAVLDTGFNPSHPEEFTWQGQPIAEYLELDMTTGAFAVTNLRRDFFTPDGHGTPVSSIIAAVNDGSSPLSGVLNSLVGPDERPFPISVYGSKDNSVPPAATAMTLLHIKARGDIDVVNMSFGGRSQTFRPAIRALRGRTLVVASSGNDGITIDNYPAALASTEPNVVAVAAVGVLSPETDKRVSIPGLVNYNPARSIRCNTADENNNPAKASNCGRTTTLAAPGNHVYALKRAEEGGYQKFTGTSAAAPLVAGAAGILQAIRPTDARLAPGQLKELLATTATNIGALDPTWRGSMKRLDIYTAVDTLLNLQRPNTVYVSDHDALNGVGAVIAIDVEPLSGRPAASATRAIQLDVTVDEQPVRPRHPRTIAIKPNGSELYAYAETDQGDGLVVVDTTVERAVDFIPLIGPTCAVNSIVSFRSAQTRPPMAFTKDGRLLYLAVGLGIQIINAERRDVVCTFADLPPPYSAESETVAGQLPGRLAEVERQIQRAGGTAISGLEISPDGATLFVLVQRGNGTGSQAGFVFPVNVNLYRDANFDDGLQSDLTDYFKPTAPFGLTAAGRPSSDEPSDLAVSADGRQLYVVNGGVNYFTAGVKLGQTTLETSQEVIAESTSGLLILDPNYGPKVEKSLKEGITIAVAPGVVEMFDLSLPTLQAHPRFASDINPGWKPSPESGGLVLSQRQPFERVYSKRPYSIAMRPDGRRALLAYFQSGNFGVLDLEAQTKFPPPQPSVPDGAFSGVVGVTPAIPLDKNLWPSRGVETTPPTASPDQRLMFPTQVEYAQNGRFAVAIHTGTDVPPDFPPDESAGGAVSFIRDEAITADLLANAGTSVPRDGFDRPFYAQFPICASHESAIPEFCRESAVTTVYQHLAGPFARPRGLAIAPILQVESPRFRDYVNRTTEIQLRWNAPIVSVNVRVFDVTGHVPPAPLPAPVATRTLHRSAEARSLKTSLLELVGAAGLTRERIYRIELTLHTLAGDLSSTSIDVVLIQ
jgi:hypothetical protein